MARRSARLWAADNDLQPSQSLVSAPCLAAHLREDGGRRPHSRRAFHRQQPRQSPIARRAAQKGGVCRPVAFALTPGNVADVVMAVPLLGAVAKPKRLLADKAYGADSLRRWLKQRKIRAAIPSTASRRTPYPFDRAAYKRRNVIERMFCKPKNWRPVATRYDRLARNYLSSLALAAIIITWT